MQQNSPSSLSEDSSVTGAVSFSYGSSYSSESNMSDPVRSYNKLRKQGSRSSVLGELGKRPQNGKRNMHLLRERTLSLYFFSPYY